MAKLSKNQRSPCPVAGALDIIGDRWTLLVIRDMLFGKQRFDDFLKSPERIATNILSQRLKWLIENGLTERTPDPKDGRKVIYTLTERGASLQPLIDTIAEWGLNTIHDVAIHPDYQAHEASPQALDEETSPTEPELHEEHFDFDRVDLL
ncbi:MAG: winged helix-turn-helix transcriptional regulator [Lentimonas sp.]